MIKKECHQKVETQIKRELATEISKVKGNVEKILYELMVELFIACRKQKTVVVKEK